MHAKDARARNEGEQRLHVPAAWREAPVYSPRERAALASLTVAINGWNRLAVGLHTPVGNYVPFHPATGT